MPGIRKEQGDSILHLCFVSSKTLLLLDIAAFSLHASERNINQECWQTDCWLDIVTGTT